MKKVNWINVIKLVVLILCISIILHDMYMLIIGYTWSWLGAITFILFCTIADFIVNDFEEQIKSIQSHRPKCSKDTNLNNF